MSAARISWAGYICLAAAVVAGPFSHRVHAGPITPGAIKSSLEINMSPVQGQAVASSNLVIEHYQSLGVNGSIFKHLSAATLINIGGVTAFAPVSNGATGYSLNFHSFIGLQIVKPSDGTPSTARSVTVEFIGMKPESGYLYAMSPEGGILGATLADDGFGPNGGFLATLNFENIGAIAMWSLAPELLNGTSADPWGIASIMIDNDVVRTPEPATVSLAFAGIVGAAGMVWKRRRPTGSG